MNSLFLPFPGAVRPWICQKNLPSLVILPDERQSEEFFSDGQSLLPEIEFFLMPEIPLEKSTVDSPSIRSVRGRVFSDWIERGGLLVTTPGGVLAPFSDGGTCLSLTLGHDLGRDFLISWLSKNGFSRVDLVWHPGDYAVRGSLVDFFDPSSKMPVRVSFFDDEIEEIRLFSTGDQMTRYRAENWTVRSVSGSGLLSIARLEGFKKPVTIFDPRRCEVNSDNFRWLWNDLTERWTIDKDEWPSFVSRIKDLTRVETETGPRQTRPALSPAPRFRGSLSQAMVQIDAWKRDGFKLLLRTSTPPPGTLSEMDWQKAPLSSGFVDYDRKTVVLSDGEIYGISFVKDSGKNEAPSDLSMLWEKGCWLVHEDHGLCRFDGMEIVEGSWGSQEFIALSFHGAQRLLLPVSQVDRLSLYGGAEGESLTPDVLGSSRWKNAVQRAEKHIEEEARELLDLYAERQLSSGRPFDPEAEMMNQFAALFPHTETKDQAQAIKDVMKDMGSPFPMDRLIVGDVGYGKTEVALRASFRAVLAGAQVLILVPTTVLAQQHFVTFQERMAPFGVSVEQLSRFIPARKQDQILKRLSEGKADVVIGTHRLLQKDISIPNLGLIVIDEEHRFGAAHKERLRRLKQGVDVLTLSATPIPRTLSMALRGMRDISSIETPPVSRSPVVTVTGPWSDSMVERAIAKELARGGQVYFLHNRVLSINRVARSLEVRFPEAEVALAHGQMGESELEEIMVSFYEGSVDILVCTTIIESGLDVGRANTLIVDDSRSLGLAQMHQLRGRVGRRDETAYAFFLYPADVTLPYSTGERLDAIGRMSFQGAGYEIARQDLRLRGGGDPLGFSQHGHRERIGVQLYYRKLQEKIAQLRGENSKTTTVDIKIPLSIPSWYIPQSAVRMAVYRRIGASLSWENRAFLEAELEDRFGSIPPEVRAMMDAALLRTEGLNKGIIHLAVDDRKTVVFLQGKGQISHPLWRHEGSSWVGPGGKSGIRSLVDALFS